MTSGNIGSSQAGPQNTPAHLGYRMPAEWVRHEATWLAWPHHEAMWPGRRLDKIRHLYLEIMEALLDGEKVYLLVPPDQKEEILKFIRAAGLATKNLVLHPVLTQDVWIRDYGPIFLKKDSGQKAWCKWRFNAWGLKYKTLLADNEVFREAASIIPYPCFHADLVLEGGAIEVNGEGVCLANEQCLLNENRNPGIYLQTMEHHLKDYLGVSHFVWLKEGIVGDDTNGHIDNLARFVSADTILVAAEDNSSDENYDSLKINWDCLVRSKDRAGKRWNLVPLPMPGRVVEKGQRFPASYANFYVGNKVVLLPVFGHPHDDRAFRILREHFPDRIVLCLSCRHLITGQGAIHCITQQEPA
ncbi:MAG: agmatine deiminase family protein [Candidatus Omnitrophica bacterium]|nr:agmatine deiminase family protein [Candidatus Omnitrophota bacterium]